MSNAAIWSAFGAFVVLALVAGFWADTYGQGKKAKKPVGRHANTGELPTKKHKLADDWHYTTAEQPVVRMTARPPVPRK